MTPHATGEARRWVGVFAAISLAYVLFVLVEHSAPGALLAAELVMAAAGAAFGLGGALLARSAFSPGDHQRRVWSWLSAAALLLFLDNAVRTRWLWVAPGRSVFDDPAFLLRTGLIVATNVVQSVGYVLLARTYRLSGLGRPRSKVSMVLLSLPIACGLLIAVPLFPGYLRQLAEDARAREVALMGLSSTLGDLVTLALVLPLLRVARRLRGGSLSWVFWAISFTGAIWLLYDASDWLASVLPGSQSLWLELFKVTRFLGLAGLGLAGLLQWSALAVTRARLRAAAES